MTRFTGRLVLGEHPPEPIRPGEVRSGAWVSALPDWPVWLERHPELDPETVERVGSRRVRWSPAEPVPADNTALFDEALAVVREEQRAPAPAQVSHDGLRYVRDPEAPDWE